MNINNGEKAISSKNIPCALIFGGKGYEHSISRLGAVNFLKTAKDLCLDLVPVYIDKCGNFYIYNGDIELISEIDRELPQKNLKSTFPVKLSGKSGFLVDEKIIPVKAAIPLLHGDFGEDGRVQGLLDMADITYVGADTMAGALTSDKAYSKIIAEHFGVKTLPFLVYEREDFNFESAEADAVLKFGYPMFIKPCRLGSSVGASLAKSKEKFALSIKNAFSVSERILIEPAILNKREIECAYYKVADKKIVSAPGEVLTYGRFYDYDAKYSKESNVTAVSKASLKKEIADKIMLYTDTLANAFSIRHIARFDYFLLPDETVYFNEVNTFPGMTDASLYSAMLKESGIDFSAFVSELASIRLW